MKNINLSNLTFDVFNKNSFSCEKGVSYEDVIKRAKSDDQFDFASVLLDGGESWWISNLCAGGREGAKEDGLYQYWYSIFTDTFDAIEKIA